MAAGFVKVAADLDSNPKIRRAGRAGREVFLFVLRRTNLQERDGRCSLSNVEPWYLADQLMMPEADAAEGVQRAIAAGLIALDGGQVVVCGWDDEWAKRPAEGAERTERWRNKRRAEQASTKTSAVTSPADAASPAAKVTPVCTTTSPATRGRDVSSPVTPSSLTSSPVPDPASPVTDMTSPIVTQCHGDESDGSDQIRVDQIRVDLWPDAPSAPSDTHQDAASSPPAGEVGRARASRAARSQPMPTAWTPRSDELALAKTLGVSPTGEAESFRDHHSAKGTRFVDWDAAFRTWLRNAVKFSRGGAPPARLTTPSFFDLVDSAATPEARP